MIKRPFLACSENITVDILPHLSYPIYVTPKLDGIRCLVGCKDKQLTAFSRKLLPIPNLSIQEWAAFEGITGFDGEIVIPGMDFNDVQSFVMSELTLPKNWEYHIFDFATNITSEHYLHRIQKLEALINTFNPSRVKLLKPLTFHTPENLANHFKKVIEKGGEGLILRHDTFYKQGRSTLLEQYMLKMKAYEEAEAIIIGFEPELANNNPQTKDETGQAKRSSHKANKQAKETLGRFLVRNETCKQFSIGAAITDIKKQEIWNNRSRYMGLTLTYKYQPHGTKKDGLPRHPIFKGIRRD